MDLHAVGDALDVRIVLEGSIRRSGQRVRITAQLSDATDGFRMWSERYDRAIDDVFAVQNEIATAIAEKLKSTLLQNPVMSAQRAPENIAAYDAYLNGRAPLYLRRRLEALEVQHTVMPAHPTLRRIGLVNDGDEPHAVDAAREHDRVLAHREEASWRARSDGT